MRENRATNPKLAGWFSASKLVGAQPTCIGSMNLERVRLGGQGAVDVSSAELFCRPDAGSTLRFMESPLGLAAVHWDCEPVWTNACSICYTNSLGSFVGSWKAPSSTTWCGQRSADRCSRGVRAPHAVTCTAQWPQLSTRSTHPTFFVHAPRFCSIVSQ